MIKDIFFSSISAAFSIFSFPNFNLEFLAFIGFVPLFYALQNKSRKQAFWISYLCGAIFYLGILYWLVHVTLVGLILLVLYLAIYFGLFGFTLHFTLYTLHKRPLTPLLIVPAIWAVLEYIQSHLLTGFGWALLGHSQFKNLPLIQIADFSGVYGVSFVIMMANVAIYRALRKSFRELVIAGTVIVAAVGYGVMRENEGKWGDSVKVSVVQGNIPQEIKWDPEAKEAILNKYIVLTRMATLDNPDLIIWPESSVPGYWGKSDIRQRVLNLAIEIKKPILVGAITEREFQYFNSAILISKEGKAGQYYDKIHLVPFGEFVPFERRFPKLRDIISVDIGDFTAGRKFQVFRQGALNFSTLICFEDMFPDLVRQFAKQGSEVLVVITNDAWFKRSSAPYQHAAGSVFRAVENRRSVIRGTNTGFSCFIEPSGKIFDSVKDEKNQNLFVTGYKTAKLPIVNSTTFYTRFGDVFVGLCIITSLIFFYSTLFVK